MHSLERVRWEWVVATFALMILSEFGFVLSWRSIVDPENLLERDGRGALDRHARRLRPARRRDARARRLAREHRRRRVDPAPLRDAPATTIAERQFNLSFLNTAVSALALIVFGVALATGIVPNQRNLLLTLLPAAVAASGCAAVLLIARRATNYAPRLEPRHPKLASSINSLAVRRRGNQPHLVSSRWSHEPARGDRVPGIRVLVLWVAFTAIHAHPAPNFAVVAMAYIIGALGASIPLPAGIGAVGRITGMLVLYGVAHETAVAAVLLYEAVGLLVPLVGGGIAHLILRRELGPIQTSQDGGPGSSDESSPR